MATVSIKTQTHLLNNTAYLDNEHSLIERCVRSIKKLFFKLLLEFSTLTYENLLHIVNLTYNQRVHTSLHGFSPIEAHFDSHVASIVAKRTLASFKRNQVKLKNIFKLNPKNVFHVNDLVLLKKKKHTFHRASAVFHPHFEDDIRKIKAVDKTMLPYTYSISGFPQERKFYFWELHRITPLYGKIKIADPSRKSKIYVQSCKIVNPPALRSGKQLKNRETILYTIQRDNQTDTATAQDLLHFKKTLGNNILVYDSFFDQPQNRHLKL